MLSPWENTQQGNKILEVCRQLVAGKISCIQASRSVADLTFDLWPAHGDKWIHDDFRVFYSVKAASDHLPLGAVRIHWSPEALREKDVEIKTIEGKFYEEAVSVAEGLLERHMA